MAQWQKAGATVTAYSDLAAGTATDPIPAGNVDEVGLGIEGGAAGWELDKGEGIVIKFEQAQTHFSVGLRELYTEGSMVEDGTETASWAAYKDGKVVARGTVDGTTQLNDQTMGTGKAQFEMDVPDGADQLLFYSEENGSDYVVEYVDTKNAAGCGASSGGG